MTYDHVAEGHLVRTQQADSYGYMGKIEKVEREIDDLKQGAVHARMEILDLKSQRAERRLGYAVIGACAALIGVVVMAAASASAAGLYEEAMMERLKFWAILGAMVLFALLTAVIITLPFAYAQSRDLTGGEMLQHYQAGGVSKDTVSMYVMGVVDGMGMSGTICVPQNKTKGDYVRQVVYNLGANEQLHERRFDVAVSSAAVVAYPCGEAS